MAKKRKALHEFMTPRFWNVHYAIPAAIGFMALGMALGMAHFTSFSPLQTQAHQTDHNIRGWAWTPTIGWISLNDYLPVCATTPNCGYYGLNIAIASTAQPDGKMGHSIDGFAWSDNVGFVCFGNSCNTPACRNGSPSPPGSFYAYAEPVTNTSYKKLHGYGVVCNQKDGGWISLNCDDTGVCPGGPASTYYQVVYNPANQQFHNAAANGSPFGWNGNNDGSGIGYISFYPSVANGMRYIPTSPENTDPLCSDLKDNDLNGYIDCSDFNCIGRPVCPEICTNGLDDDGDTLIDCADPDCMSIPGQCPENTAPLCTDTLDNDADTKIDCADNDCFATGVCSEVCTGGLDEDNDSLIDCFDPDCPACAEICTGGVDDDGDTLIDCADPDCAADPACAPPQHQCLDFAALPPAQRADACCNDESDNFTGLLDCIDPDCQNNAAVCSAWLRVDTGNIFSQGGILGTSPSAATNLKNTKYCLRSDNSIEWTSENEACKKEDADPISLPTFSTEYRNKLGFLDIAGIKKQGRYGTVIPIADESQIFNPLSGNIYYFSGSGEFVLSAKTFLNGTTAQGNGAGLLIIEGADLRITGSIGYSTDAVQDRLKNLASFGVIVLKNGSAGGNIYINPGVQKVSGTYFAEDTIYTGTNSSGLHNDVLLKMYGVFVARQFNLQRDNNQNPSLAAEEIIFDGRSVVNPPPGMQDAAKSLPRPLDANF